MSQTLTVRTNAEHSQRLMAFESSSPGSSNQASSVIIDTFEIEDDDISIIEISDDDADLIPDLFSINLSIIKLVKYPAQKTPPEIQAQVIQCSSTADFLAKVSSFNHSYGSLSNPN